MHEPQPGLILWLRCIDQHSVLCIPYVNHHLTMAAVCLQVLQRNLPRPAMPTHPERGPTGREQLPKEAAELMIHAELVSLQEHDNIKHPLKASQAAGR